MKRKKNAHRFLFASLFSSLQTFVLFVSFVVDSGGRAGRPRPAL